MIKQEKIQEAYGEYWDKAKDYVDSNGWIDNKKMINDRVGMLFLIEMDVIESPRRLRPKSLQGIENNNGWIKIESEDDLPTIEGSYFVFSKVNYKPYYRIDIFTGRLSNSFENGKSCFSHYQPIIKPQLPIY